MRIKLTQDHINTLRNEINRTDVGIGPLFKTVDRMPAYMSENIARGWLRGQTLTALTENWHWLLETYRGLPDADFSHRKLSAGRIQDVASLEDRKRVRTEFERTGVGGRGIFDLLTSFPNNLSENDCINALANPLAKRRATHIQAILEVYASLPDNPYAPITGDTVEELLKEIERTKLSFPNVIKLLGDDVPDDLNSRTIYHWTIRTAKSAKRGYVERVLVALAALPDAVEDTRRRPPKRKSKTQLTPSLSLVDYNKLWSLRKKTNLSPHALLSDRSDVPEGLTPSMINAWLFKKERQVCPKLLEYVFDAYNAALQFK